MFFVVLTTTFPVPIYSKVNVLKWQPKARAIEGTWLFLEFLLISNQIKSMKTKQPWFCRLGRRTWPSVWSQNVDAINNLSKWIKMWNVWRSHLVRSSTGASLCLWEVGDEEQTLCVTRLHFSECVGCDEHRCRWVFVFSAESEPGQISSHCVRLNQGSLSGGVHSRP